ncbi:MAG: hypothetical protein LBQ54_16270 [Planctomycetaceae bacterium]|nr:hypothetical protein [Planctomycetaceae bacterium]
MNGEKKLPEDKEKLSSEENASGGPRRRGGRFASQHLWYGRRRLKNPSNLRPKATGCNVTLPAPKQYPVRVAHWEACRFTAHRKRLERLSNEADRTKVPGGKCDPTCYVGVAGSA